MTAHSGEGPMTCGAPRGRTTEVAGGYLDRLGILNAQAGVSFAHEMEHGRIATSETEPPVTRHPRPREHESLGVDSPKPMIDAIRRHLVM